MNKNLLLFLKMRLKNYMNKSYYVWNHLDVLILRDFYKVFNKFFYFIIFYNFHIIKY